ncbi:hypothetical protein P8452_05888 [Trifolium repens]|nr:hypothetical protein P8452_05888 [Trifolium repens]
MHKYMNWSILNGPHLPNYYYNTMVSAESRFFSIGGVDNLLTKYKDKVKWVKRKSKLLEALLEDHDQLRKKQEEVESRVRSFWDIEDLSQIHLHLNKNENEWVKSTKEVVNKAHSCCREYDKQRPMSIWGNITYTWDHNHITYIFGWMTPGWMTPGWMTPKDDVLHKEIDGVESKLASHFENKDEQAKDIHMSMEESRSKARSLLDQYTTEEGHKSKAGELHNFVEDQDQNQRQPSTSFDDLIKMSMEMDLFSCMEERRTIYLLLPLHAFLKDLNQLQLETETEKCWRKVAEEIIKDAEIHLRNYLWWFQSFGKLMLKTTPFVTHPFREKMKLIVTEFNKLLKYNLTFIDRAAEKSTFTSTAMDTEITSAIKTKLRNLETSSGLVDKMNSMCDALNEMHNQLKKAEATEGSNACINQLTAIVEELNNFLEVEQVNGLELYQIEMKNAIDLLQHLTKTCIIERPESTKVVNFRLPLIFKEQGLVLNLIASTDNASKICIMGMKGVGKTTLAKRVYYNKVVVNHFPTRVWITVIAGANKRTKVLLMKNDGTKDQTLTVKQVSGHLIDMPCLVVLDNVSQKNDFDDLHRKLCVSQWQRGGRMVVTTCFKEVASHVDSRSTVHPIPLHHIPLLTKEESWALFQKVAAIEKSELKKMETFAKKVVGKCGGLPLAILSLGFAISAKGIAQKSFFKEISQSMGWRRIGATEQPRDARRHCRNLPRGVERSQHDSSCGTKVQWQDCLPSMLREIILQNRNRTNHSQYFGIPMSVLFFDKREGSEPGKRVGNILSTGIASEQFLKTRVIDLECIFRPQLPKTLCMLNNLKYLSLRWTYLEELPGCICKLQELETLDLKHTCINYIPRSIWKLKKLKKLYLPQNFRSKLEGKPRGNVNETLHTLWGVFLYGNYPLLGCLHKLNRLQKLKLAFQLNGSEQELQNTLAQKIVQLKQLHSLTLKSVDETGGPENLILTDMENLEKLSSLRLFGQLEDTLHERLLPQSLTDLTLSASKLSVDPMPELQKLPMLKSLCFYADSFIEKKMVCGPGGFQQLQVLRFWNLENLEEWDVKEGAMPSLVEFEVRSCKKLAVPTGLKHLKTIRIIKLRKMPDPFVHGLWYYDRSNMVVRPLLN